MNNAMKPIEFSNAAFFAFHTLDQKNQVQAQKLLSTAKENLTDKHLGNKIQKLDFPGRTIYAIKLNQSLRIVIEIFDDRVEVVDIINSDLYKTYFNREMGEA